MFHNAYVTWTNADNMCKSLNANLVSIHSYEEHQFVRGVQKLC